MRFTTWPSKSSRHTRLIDSGPGFRLGAFVVSRARTRLSYCTGLRLPFTSQNTQGWLECQRPPLSNLPRVMRRPNFLVPMVILYSLSFPACVVRVLREGRCCSVSLYVVVCGGPHISGSPLRRSDRSGVGSFSKRRISASSWESGWLSEAVTGGLFAT
jgi:hypothetical protein